MIDKRKTYLIKRDFQVDFALKFLVLILAESLLAIGLFIYLSRGTLTSSYSGSELIVSRTRDFFLPTLLLSNLVIVVATALAGAVFLVLVSHRIAGPLHRFEKSLDRINEGDLTYRFTLREKDQMNDLCAKLNDFNSRMERSLSDMQRGLDELSVLFTEIHAAVSSGSYSKAEVAGAVKEALKRLDELEKTAGYFKTYRNTDKEAG